MTAPCALLLARECGAKKHGLTPQRPRGRGGRGRRGAAHHGHGAGAGHAQGAGQSGARPSHEMDVIELNEAFAAQALAVMRELGLADDAAHVNPNGGAIAIGPSAWARAARGWSRRRCTVASHRRALCAVHHVHRRRPGHRHDHRAHLSAPAPHLRCIFPFFSLRDLIPFGNRPHKHNLWV